MATPAITPSIPSTSTVVSLPLISTFLDKLTNTVTDIISKSINEGKEAGINLEVEAGRQILLAIQAAQQAYEKELTKTMDQVNDLIRKNLDRLESMVGDLEHQTVKDFQQFMQQAEDFILLVLPGAEPRVTRVSPRYVVLEPNTDWLLTINGRFKNVSSEKKPTLTFKDSKIEVHHTQETQLQFMVPVNKLIDTSINKFIENNNTINNNNNNIDNNNKSIKSTAYPYKVLELDIPWVEGYIWHTWHLANYKLLCLSLPPSPGKITAIYTSKIGEKILDHFTSQSFKAWGDDNYPNKWDTQFFIIRPNEGWKMDMSKQPQIIVEEGAHGTHHEKIESWNEDEVKVKVELRTDKGHYMGRINFHVEFDEQKTVIKEIPRKENIALKWGESKLLEPQQGEQFTKLIFDEFDGKTLEFAGVDSSNKYLKMKYEANNYKVMASNVEDI